MTNPEKAQLIHPPIKIMGSTLVRFPFIMSVNMLESATQTQTHSGLCSYPGQDFHLSLYGTN